MTRLSFVLTLIVLMVGCEQTEQSQWYRGNLHTHTFWSDGDDFPEQVTKWYVDNGYDFLAISDHNTIADSERWLTIPKWNARYPIFEKYLTESPEGWVEWEGYDDSVRVRLKTYEEYSGRFERPGQFVMMRAEEVSDRYGNKPIHVNATNLMEYIEPQGGESVVEVMQNNVNAILSQGERLQRRVMPHINHPNYIWAIRADELAQVDGERFFEVYNGHPAVFNYGDSLRYGTEKLWDVVNTIRLRDGRPLMFGLGTDDSHHYHEEAPNRANVGRGWVMVQSRDLEAETILEAMDNGAFYASSGVSLSEVTFDGYTYRIGVEAEEGVTYAIEFLGTNADHDPAPVAITDPESGELITYRYSDDVGRLLQRTTGTQASFQVTEDYLFVRARVTSDRVMINLVVEGEVETAWAQPVIAGQAVMSGQ